MANQAEIEFTYSLIDRIFRLSMGEMGDYSNALYDGDFSQSLEQAQHRKHEFIARQLNIGPGSRVLDMGCGWGPFLNFLRGIGAQGVGLTLSTAQARACHKNGLDVHVADCRIVTSEMVGAFDAVVSLGAFEHFCSLDEWHAGQQDAVYRSFFEVVAHLLRTNGRFYLQTMTFGQHMFRLSDVDIHAPKDSDSYALAVIRREFPGSCLPTGAEQVIEAAKPFFRLVLKSSGRLDYIETVKQWEVRYRRFEPKKYLYYLSLLPQYLANRDFRERFSGEQGRAITLCFERELFDHYRFVFEKV
jgi:cyclopropane-fatty-acyl-phospholipid synthase